jgi:NADH-quinone oxidoreductase subunit L|tara:strand:+ start:723 stop:905 length:183 start_codon:yes stop_codon:yes gene_type:complete
MIVNRIGDVGLAIGISTIFLTFKTIDYATVFALVPNVIDSTITFFSFDVNVLTAISLCLF